ncbi:MAG TPA: ABC transporter permease subunit, partial [Leptolyngbyaceae cyanobacterium]
MSQAHSPVASPLPCRPPFWSWQTGWSLVAVGAIALSLYVAGIGRPGAELFNGGGLPQAWQFLSASLHPTLAPDFLALIGRATLVTLAYAVCGTFLSVLLGFIVGILASEVWWLTLFPPRNSSLSMGQPIWLTIRGLLAIPRAIHELLWGLFFVNILGLDPLVAVLAIAIPFGAIVAKVFSELLDETPRAPLNALINSGAPPLSALLYGLLPQALPNLLSYTFYRFECSLRSAAVLGVIGAGGLGYEIFLSLQSLRYEQLWTAFYALILLNGAVDAWSALVRRRMGFASRLDLNLRKGGEGKRQKAEGRRGALSKGEGEESLVGNAHPTSSPPSNPSLPPSASPLLPSHGFIALSWFLIALSIPLCFTLLQIDWSQLWAPRTQKLLGEVFTSGVPSMPTGAELQDLVRLSGLTLAMSVLAIALAGLGSVLLSFPAAQNFLMPGGLLRPLGERGQGWPILAWVALFLSRIA